MKKVLLVALAVLLTLSFTACAFAEELPDASDLTVAGIIHTEDQFGQMIAAGMQAACDDTGAYMYRGCSNLDASKEFELVNTYASMDIDAICAPRRARRAPTPSSSSLPTRASRSSTSTPRRSWARRRPSSARSSLPTTRPLPRRLPTMPRNGWRRTCRAKRSSWAR